MAARKRKPQSLQERLQEQLDGEDAFTLNVWVTSGELYAQLNVMEVGCDFVEGSMPDGGVYLIPFNNILRIAVEY